MEPTELRENFEVNVIRCHKAFVREVQMVYPGVDMTGLLAIVTCQKAKYDLCEMGKDIDKEKDDLLESFAAFAGSVVKALKVAGAWADYIDPCSGLPATQDHANRGYSEVDGLASGGGGGRKQHFVYEHKEEDATSSEVAEDKTPSGM
eukprot:g5367.t1